MNYIPIICTLINTTVLIIYFIRSRKKKNSPVKGTLNTTYYVSDLKFHTEDEMSIINKAVLQKIATTEKPELN